MKKNLFILICLLTCMVANAKQVTEEEALLKAQSFMHGRRFVVPEATKRHAAQKHAAPAYYIFNVENQGGFVIVSGDDRTSEILGYSEKGNLDLETAPCNVRWLLNCYEETIKSLPSNKENVSRRSEGTDRQSISPLVFTEWGQGTPYNDLCPYAEGSSCLTGCVATAMAQVINYNRWPQDMTNAVNAYVSESYHISMPQLSPTKFNWDNMTSGEIARLMLYCGQSVRMDYGPAASGANEGYIAPAMIEVFGYSKSTQLYSRNQYETDAWESLIYNELHEGRPVIYCGQGSGGGHAFVVCGYQDQHFYINWGWNGNLDGYFDLSALTPISGMDFSAGQTAIVGIQPSASVSDISRPKAVVQEMTVSEKTLSRNSANDDFPTVTISSKVVSDLTTKETIQIGLGLYDADGLRQILASEEHVLKPNEPYTFEAKVNVSASLPDGDYSIKAVNRMQDSDDWLSDAASSDRYVSLTIDGNQATLQAFPKTAENKNRIEYGIHTIDSVTYRLICEYENYRAYLVNYHETEKYAGDVYVPDTVRYANMPFRVHSQYSYGYNFGNCPELTSLSIGVRSGVTNCPKLKNLEIRRNVAEWDQVSRCDALESVVFPPLISNLAAPNNCKNLKEIRFTTSQRLQLSMNNETWNAKNMPSLTDVYFNSDYPPEVEGFSELAPNPNVTIHIPQGTLAFYQQSIFRNWKLTEDQPAKPVSVAWDYSGNDESASCGMAIGRGNNNVEFAMCVPASHLTAYKGCKVTKIEFYSCKAPINDWHMGDVEYVFLTKPGTDYLAKVPFTIVRGTWNTVELPEPYIITGDQLFVGYGRNKSLEADWANLSVVDEGFYLRVMGDDTSWGMSNEVGKWQKHAGLNDWNHPLPIRFYIEGENLPTDVLIDQSEIVNADEQQSASAPAMAQPIQSLNMSDGYFTYSHDEKGLLYDANRSYIGTKPLDTKAVLRRASNGKMQIKTSVRSRTSRIIKVLTIDWTIDNKLLGSQIFETCILPNHEETFYIDLPENIQGRNHSVKVDVVEIDGEPDAIQANSSETVSFALSASTHFARRIVMEEATGTWCGWCPRGIETIKLATELYPNNFIAIGIHEGDEMYPTNRSYDSILDQFSSVPNCFINRTDMMDPSWSDVKDIIERLKDSADADINATALFTAADSSRVTVSTETVFGYSDNGTTEHRIAYVVLEDNVGPYLQANFYSDPAAADNPDNYMNSWIHQDSRVSMLYNDVARGIFDNYLGVEGSLPQIINEGETYSQDYSLKLPETIQNKKNIRIVALLLDGLTGEILNAAQCKVEYDPTIFSSVIAKSYTRYYGDENPAFEYTTEGAALDGKPELVCEAKIDSPVGVYPIIAQRGTITNRIVTYIDGQLTIEKTPLTVSVGNYTREVNQENPNFVLSYEGWKLNEDESVLKAKPRARTLATASSPVGTYEIVVTGGLATNYEFVYVNGVLTVVEASGINSIMIDGQPFDVYSLTGQKIFSKMTSLRGIPSGVYIINHKKVVVK